MTGGLVYSEKIEEMDKELTKVIEDFDHAVNVETLHLAHRTGNSSLSQPGDSPFLVASCSSRAFA